MLAPLPPQYSTAPAQSGISPLAAIQEILLKRKMAGAGMSPPGGTLTGLNPNLPPPILGTPPPAGTIYPGMTGVRG